MREHQLDPRRSPDRKQVMTTEPYVRADRCPRSQTTAPPTAAPLSRTDGGAWPNAYLMYLPADPARVRVPLPRPYPGPFYSTLGHHG